MAIYHFSVSFISRSKGRSAIASAASRAEEKLYDERLGCTARNNCKEGVLFKEILLPSTAPLWMSNREKLWNAVEKSEKRKDSRLAREFCFSLPTELNKEQSINLAKEFVKIELVSIGMVADLCIHIGKTKDGKEQPHAHVMTTTRILVNDGFGFKNKTWEAKEKLILWRAAWAKCANKHLAMNGINQKIDHRSYVDQDINLIPQNKLGLKKLKLYQYKKEERDNIVKENGNRILNDPSIILKVIANKYSVFTDRNLIRVIESYSLPEQFSKIYEKVKNSDHVVYLGKNENGEEEYTVSFNEI